MNEQIFDLRDFRENVLHLTQRQLADRLDLRQDNISRMENNPNTITLDILAKLANLSGQSLDQLTGFTPPEVPGIGCSVEGWEKNRVEGQAVLKQLEDQYGKGLMWVPKSMAFHLAQVRTLAASLAQVRTLAFSLTRKPVLTVAGNAASGKSTFINGILGKDLLLAGPKPVAVRVPVHLRHIEDRPEGEESTVYLLGPPTGIREAGRPEKWKPEVLARGGTELLFEVDGPELTEIQIFTDSRLLRGCDVVRQPALQAAGRRYPQADLLVYLIAGNIGCTTEDLFCFQEELDSLTVLEGPGHLSNLFVVWSKAHLAGEPEEAQDMAHNTLGPALYGAIPPGFWKSQQGLIGEPCTEEKFQERCFFYAVHRQSIRERETLREWREPLESQLRDAIEHFPERIREQTLEHIRTHRELLDAMLQQAREQTQRSLTEVARKSPIPPERILEDIDWHLKTSVQNFRQAWSEILTEEKLTATLKKKQGLAQVISSMKEEIANSLEEIRMQETKEFGTEIGEYSQGLSAKAAARMFELFQRNIEMKLHANSPRIQQIDQKNDQIWAGLEQVNLSPLVMASAAIDTVMEATAGSVMKAAGGTMGVIAGIGTSFAAAPLAAVAGAVTGLASTSAKARARALKEAMQKQLYPTYEEGLNIAWKVIRESFQAAAAQLQQELAQK